jgi:pseudouridine-5'-phosphate glycosidase
MDVSADLTELSLTDVAVVSAGVKSLLDIGRTLEVLETLGVPVITVGSDDFPSFYSRSSGFRSPLRLEGPDDVARTMRAKWDLGIAGGLMVANPIPEGEEIPEAEIGQLIDTAVAEAEASGISGAAITPYLLGRIVELSGGESLRANIALVKNNAALGARIAVAYAAVSA